MTQANKSFNDLQVQGAGAALVLGVVLAVYKYKYAKVSSVWLKTFFCGCTAFLQTKFCPSVSKSSNEHLLQIL
jgi:hypothetical protein